MTAPQDRILYISLEENDTRVLVGKLFFHGYGSSLATTFYYADEWLAHARAFPVAPYMPLSNRKYNFSGLPGFVSDAAPDRWGRTLIYKGLAQQAAEANQTLRTVDEYDYLVGVDDWARMGAWRFSTSAEGPFIAQGSNIPKTIALPELLHAAHSVLAEDQESSAGIKLLLSAGTSSLGGAHPKATVDDNGVLYLAKFPNINAVWDDIRWEAFCLSMAKKCGISTPDFRVIKVGKNPVLLIKRFDREKNARIPYLSAMSLLQVNDNTRVDYADVADLMRTFVADPKKNLADLFTRVVLNIALHNIDDHLRNHGFVRNGNAWELSPVFDLTVSPYADADRRTAVFGRSDAREAEGLGELAEAFGLSAAEAHACTDRVLASFATWHIEAKKFGCKESEMAIMKPIFEDRLRAL